MAYTRRLHGVWHLGGKLFNIYGQNILYSALTMVGRGTVTVECRSPDDPEDLLAREASPQRERNHF